MTFRDTEQASRQIATDAVSNYGITQHKLFCDYSKFTLVSRYTETALAAVRYKNVRSKIRIEQVGIVHGLFVEIIEKFNCNDITKKTEIYNSLVPICYYRTRVNECLLYLVSVSNKNFFARFSLLFHS